MFTERPSRRYGEFDDLLKAFHQAQCQDADSEAYGEMAWQGHRLIVAHRPEVAEAQTAETFNYVLDQRALDRARVLDGKLLLATNMPDNEPHEIWMAETREAANQAFDRTLKRFGAKYLLAMECIAKDRDELLAFYDFPAERRMHIRTTNPIKSAFATIRLRMKRSRNCGSQDTTLAMIFKLLQTAQKF